MEQTARRDLNDVLVFTRVVQSGSFTRAARALGMPKSTVSRKVSELEARLGARLLQRTTRRLSLTDVGRLYYQHSERAVSELEAADTAIAQMQGAPRGRLRVSAPLNFDWLRGMVAEFLQRNPDVQVEMVCTDRLVDLVEEGFDVAVRAGRLEDSTLVARHLTSIRRLVVASPAYLKKHGTPDQPSGLTVHPCIVFGGGRDPNRWRLENGAEIIEAQVPARLTVNDFEMVREAALAGLGIAMLQLDRCAEDLQLKRLRRVLPSWVSPEAPVQAVYPSTRHLSPKVKAFVDHLHARLTPPPWERTARE
jgi:DNA-binding transcriptional LysR family regulator